MKERISILGYLLITEARRYWKYCVSIIVLAVVATIRRHDNGLDQAYICVFGLTVGIILVALLPISAVKCFIIKRRDLGMCDKVRIAQTRRAQWDIANVISRCIGV